jgi:hypothetical protein
MTLSKRNVALLASLALVVASVVGFFAPSAEALPPTYRYTEWYSDGTYTVLVGWRLRNCQGVTTSWGTTSSFPIIEVDFCGIG